MNATIRGLGITVVIGLLVSLAICLLLEPTAGYSSPGPSHFTWVRAIPEGQGDWPRFTQMVVGFGDKLWAVEPAAPQKFAFTSADGVRWTRTPANAAWGERYRPAVAFFKGRMWFFGGRSGTVQNPTFHDDVWSSENGADWKRVTPSAGWTPRWDHSALIFGDKLWVLGGFGRDGYADDIWFTPDGVNWTRATEKAPWSKWKYRSFVVFRDRIWAIGFHVGNDVWSSSDGANWQQATPNAGWPASSRYKHAVVFQGLLWVMGGADAKGNFENDVWLSTDGVRWEQFTPRAPWNPRAANYSVVFQKKLWIFGGKNADDDAWYLFHKEQL